MNIINIGRRFEFSGGAGKYFEILADLLEEYGHDVTTFEPRNSKYQRDLPSDVNFDNPSLIDIYKFIYNKEAQIKLRKKLNSNSFDIAHLHIYYGKLSSSILPEIKSAGIPIIQTLHEYKIICPVSKLYNGVEICKKCKGNQFHNVITNRCNRGNFLRSILSYIESSVSLSMGSQKLIDHFITVSDYQKNILIDMGIAPEKLTTVHNFIDAEHIPVNFEKENYILYFGRIEKEKGIDTLLEAMSKIKKNTRLVFMGDGGYSNHLVKTIEKNNFKNIDFIGFKTGRELISVIMNASIVIVPSIWYEPFGYTVVEAMACGTPVIGSNLGGITEIIDEDKNGMIFNAGNSDELADKINYLISSPTLIKEMGKSARFKIENSFSKGKHYNDILNVYKRFIY